MNSEDIKAEIQHQHELISGYRKRQRILEQQAAVFGLQVPPHIQIEIDELGDKIQSCGQRIALLEQSQQAPPGQPPEAGAEPGATSRPYEAISARPAAGAAPARAVDGQPKPRPAYPVVWGLIVPAVAALIGYLATTRPTTDGTDIIGAIVFVVGVAAIVLVFIWWVYRRLLARR